MTALDLSGAPLWRRQRSLWSAFHCSWGGGRWAAARRGNDIKHFCRKCGSWEEKYGRKFCQENGDVVRNRRKIGVAFLPELRPLPSDFMFPPRLESKITQKNYMLSTFDIAHFFIGFTEDALGLVQFYFRLEINNLTFLLLKITAEIALSKLLWKYLISSNFICRAFLNSFNK